MKYFNIREENNKIHLLDEISEDLIQGRVSNTFIEITEETDKEFHISESLKNGFEVVYDKDVLSFTDKNTMFMDISGSDVNKIRVLKLAQNKMESLINKLDMITYINYIDINNELSTRGFIVTESNREEVYLDILETGDEDLIDMLGEYLEIKDTLAPIKSARSDFAKTKELIINTKESDTIELDRIENLL